MKRRYILVIGICLIANFVVGAQGSARTYEDITSTTRLTFRDDGTFELTETDPIFTNTFRKFTSTGNWVANGEEVILNPGLTPRNADISLKESKLVGEDSVTIVVHYSVHEFEKDHLVSSHAVDLDMMSVGVNKKSNYHHLVRGSSTRICLFAPRVKHQVVVDSTNTFRIRKTKIECLWFYTYGLPSIVELRVKDPDSNHFVIDVVQPVDIERMPRSKKMVVKCKKAFYYQKGSWPLMMK